MTPELARRMLAGALILGVAGNWLLRDEWRAGFTLWALLVLSAAFLSAQHATRRRANASSDALLDATPPDVSIQRERKLLFACAAALSTLFVLRDADLLFALNFFALLVVSALIAWRAGGRSLARLEPRDAAVGGLASVATVVTGAASLAFRDAQIGTVSEHSRRSFGFAGIGAMAALPVLLVVALLLGSADPLFASALSSATNMLDARVVGHLLGSVGAAWLVAGAMRGSLVPAGIVVRAARLDVRVPFVTVAPLLGGLSLLITAWVALQLRTLFGGAQYVATTGGVTVAEYARAGFFELIVIAGIVLAALLVADELLDRHNQRVRHQFRRAGLVLLVLVAAVLVSAVFRLTLYLRFYGLTEDRVLAFAVLVWVAAVLSWFGATVLRQRRTQFAPGVLVLSVCWLGLLNVINPERLIVETNLQRAERGLTFDAAYHARLSGDALPALLRGAERLSAVQSAELRTALTVAWARRAEQRDDWRGWSVPHVLGVRRMTLPTTLSTPIDGTTYERQVARAHD